MLNSKYVFFDAIVSHLCLRQAIGQDFYTLASKQPYLDADDMIKKYATHPIKTIDGIMQCSIMEFYRDGTQIDLVRDARVVTIYKRFDEDRSHQIPTRKTKVSIGSGLLKNYAIKIPIIAAEYADIHLIAKPKALLTLLNHLTNVGKRYALGFGQVKSISILPAIKKGIIYEGIAMRPIPIKLLSNYTEVQMLPFRVPYWSRANMELCAVPGSECIYGSGKSS